ncbi:hypothetical protein GEMRC1_009965 [Eukaryota sp. GEM-RC1]
MTKCVTERGVFVISNFGIARHSVVVTPPDCYKHLQLTLCSAANVRALAFTQFSVTCSKRDRLSNISSYKDYSRSVLKGLRPAPDTRKEERSDLMILILSACQSF